MDVKETFLVMGCLYFAFMLFGVFTVRLPPLIWKPAGWDPSKRSANKMITSVDVSAENAIRTPQFYFLFFVLMLNVTARGARPGLSHDPGDVL